MKAKDMAKARLSSQGIVGSKPLEAREAMARMTAIQAQDFEMAKWALGLRTAQPRRSRVEAAIDSGEIIRIHLLRPTWHLVARDDVRWILELSAPRIKAGLASRHRQLSITASVLGKSLKIMGRVLAERGQLGRKELISSLEEGGVATDESRASHLLLFAELEALICSGGNAGRETRYALLDERAPRGRGLGRDEALARLALSYFRSRGPAALEDFAWWSGLTAGDARKAVDSIAGELDAVEIGGRRFLLSDAAAASRDPGASLLLLPAFDEYLISYADRTAAITDADHAKAVSSNGLFWPTIVAGGRVVGTWALSAKGGRREVTSEPFGKLGTAAQAELESRARAFLGFRDG